MRLFHLSLRFKLPLWGGGLIVITALALSTSFILQAWDDINQDLQRNAMTVGRTLAHSLYPALLHDDMWGAFEIITLPFAANPGTSQTESLIVLDIQRKVYVSSRPEAYPVLSPLANLGPDFAALDGVLPMAPSASIFVRDASAAERIDVAVPISDDRVRLGTLIVSYNKSMLEKRFELILMRSLWITLLVLGVLLPTTAYWGQRMMLPMRLVTQRISSIGSGEPEALDPALYPYHDEVGQLFLAYETVRAKLLEKARFEMEMVKSERMAAVGRLTASIAHEINNPLGGMLNAISTLKRHGKPDAVTQKTVSLLERGLSQIRETVAALLVESKVKSRPLNVSDFEDVCVLVAHATKKQATHMTWDVLVTGEITLPSTLVRQVLINLLLNAIAAAGQAGEVRLHARADRQQLVIGVENSGKSMSTEQLARLYEPFTSFSENGNGLGLWICYQIITQLGGTIRAESGAALTRFTVVFPLSEHHENPVEQDLPD